MALWPHVRMYCCNEDVSGCCRYGGNSRHCDSGIGNSSSDDDVEKNNSDAKVLLLPFVVFVEYCGDSLVLDDADGMSCRDQSSSA